MVDAALENNRGWQLDWSKEPDLPRLRRAYDLLFSQTHVPGGVPEAVSELAALADNGSIAAMSYLAVAYAKGKGVKVDLDRAEDWFRRAADGGQLLTVYSLGCFYDRSRRFQEDRIIFEALAAQDFTPALWRLGRMYQYGRAVEKDNRKAYHFLRRSSEAGNLRALGYFGVLLARGGFGIVQRLSGAISVLRAAAKITSLKKSDPGSTRLL